MDPAPDARCGSVRSSATESPVDARAIAEKRLSAGAAEALTGPALAGSQRAKKLLARAERNPFVAALRTSDLTDAIDSALREWRLLVKK